MSPETGGSGDKGKGEGVMNVHVPESRVELGRSLVRALDNTGISVLYQDLDLRVVWARNIPDSWARRDLTGLTDVQFLPEPEAVRVVAAKRETLASGQQRTLEVRIHDSTGPRWFKFWVDADRHGEEDPVGIVTTAVDITEQKQREQALKALLREVSHRSKNLLAIIQSVATQTGRYSGTIDTFLARFRGRLQSLASSQDIVTSTNWRGADLHELALSQVSRYSSDPSRSIRIRGASPFLNPNAALHIGLALHELAMNSVTHGALSRNEHPVDLSARVLSAADTGTPGGLELVWSEQLPAGVEALKEKRFGSVALERVVPASLDGEATLVSENGSLTYRLVVPAGSFEHE